MAGRDRYIDPLTGDYVKDGKGSYLTTETIHTKAYHQIAGNRNQWVGDFDGGSDIYLYERDLDDEDSIKLVLDAARASLKRLVDQGEGADLQLGVVEAQAQRVGQLFLEGSIRDVQHAEEIDLTPMLPLTVGHG